MDCTTFQCLQSSFLCSSILRSYRKKFWTPINLCTNFDKYTKNARRVKSAGAFMHLRQVWVSACVKSCFRSVLLQTFFPPSLSVTIFFCCIFSNATHSVLYGFWFFVLSLIWQIFLICSGIFQPFLHCTINNRWIFRDHPNFFRTFLRIKQNPDLHKSFKIFFYFAWQIFINQSFMTVFAVKTGFFYEIPPRQQPFTIRKKFKKKSFRTWLDSGNGVFFGSFDLLT